MVHTWFERRAGGDTEKVSEAYELATGTQSYRYALDPTSEQIEALHNHFEASWFFYNRMLGLVADNWEWNQERKTARQEVRPQDYAGTSQFDRLYVWSMIHDDVAPWWSEVS